MQSETTQRVVESFKQLAENLHEEYRRKLDFLQGQCEAALQEIVRVEFTNSLGYWQQVPMPHVVFNVQAIH
jgi:hypothetical protein